MTDNAYLTLRYSSKSRWLSYWYQISAALEISPEDILVVGKGSGVTDNTLKLITGGKIKVVTVDIDPSVSPDIVGSVTELAFDDGTFDVAICCQVLEHIPFEMFPVALRELQRVISRRLVLSLPHARKFFRLSVSLPYLGEKDMIVKYPFTKKSIRSKNHFWEIGRPVSRREVVKEIGRYFEIEKEFLNEINGSHRFFILKKADRT